MTVKKKIKKVISKARKAIRKHTYKHHSVFLVYTMGKVGSASMYLSLKRRFPFAYVFHVHFLSRHWLKERLPKEHEIFHSNIELGESINQIIAKNPRLRIKIITLVREPVVRAISDLFQNWKHQFDNLYETPLAELQEYIENVNYDYTLEWFDTEFKNYTGVDIYKLPFDPEKGYAIYQLERFDMLCIQLEQLNRVGQQAIKEFVGEDIALISSNTSAKKKGSNQYSYLKKNVRIDPKKLDAIYNSPLMKHFYTEEQLKEFKAKWSKKD